MNNNNNNNNNNNSNNNNNNNNNKQKTKQNVYYEHDMNLFMNEYHANNKHLVLFFIIIF